MATQLEWLLGRYLGIRPRSEQEVRRYITQKRRKIAISDTFVEELISRYKELGIIDDAKFAEALSHSLIVNKSKGKKILQMKLKQAGVQADTAQQALQAIDPEEVKNAMTKRLARFESKWSMLDTRTRFAKAYSKLLSSGFSSSEIRPFLDEWCQNR